MAIRPRANDVDARTSRAAQGRARPIINVIPERVPQGESAHPTTTRMQRPLERASGAAGPNSPPSFVHGSANDQSRRHWSKGTAGMRPPPFGFASRPLSPAPRTFGAALAPFPLECCFCRRAKNRRRWPNHPKKAIKKKKEKGLGEGKRLTA